MWCNATHMHTHTQCYQSEASRTESWSEKTNQVTCPWPQQVSWHQWIRSWVWNIAKSFYHLSISLSPFFQWWSVRQWGRGNGWRRDPPPGFTRTWKHPSSAKCSQTIRGKYECILHFIVSVLMIRMWWLSLRVAWTSTDTPVDQDRGRTVWKGGTLPLIWWV